jgi:predicted RNA-binding protein
MRVGWIDVDEDEVRIVIIDIFGKSRAVEKLDRIDAG